VELERLYVSDYRRGTWRSKVLKAILRILIVNLSPEIANIHPCNSQETSWTNNVDCDNYELIRNMQKWHSQALKSWWAHGVCQMLFYAGLSPSPLSISPLPPTKKLFGSVRIPRPNMAEAGWPAQPWLRREYVVTRCYATDMQYAVNNNQNDKLCVVKFRVMRSKLFI